jgi:hypothetical protein
MTQHAFPVREAEGVAAGHEADGLHPLAGQEKFIRHRTQRGYHSMMTAVRTAVPPATFEKLRLFNAAMAVLHFVQGVMMLVLSNDFSLPVTTSFLEFDEVSEKLVVADDTLLDLRIAPLVASFLFISAFAHLALTLPGVYQWYVRNLRSGINYARWYEYALSASVMIVVIAMLTGMYDLGGLILIFALNAAMISFGLLMEVQNHGAVRVNWTPFVLGSVVGVIPWIVIALYLLAPASRSIGDVPTFVYAIYISLFIWFNMFAVNMFLQYRKVGPWRDYLFGERMYIILSLTAKSLLAWQVFAGTLRPV